MYHPNLAAKRPTDTVETVISDQISPHCDPELVLLVLYCYQ